MLVYGKNVAREILKSNENVKKIYIDKDFTDKEILHLINIKNITVENLNKSEIDKLVKGVSQGIALNIKDYHFMNFDDIRNNAESSFIVMLDHIEDPHNFGAIIRTCECAGVDYIIVPNKRNAEINATVMKTSAGALTNVKIVEVANLNNTMEKLKKLGYWIVGTDADGLDYNKIDYKQKIVLIIGSEGEGLKQIVRNSCDYIASLPLKGKVNSLNASVAAGIMIYEVVKAREN